MASKYSKRHDRLSRQTNKLEFKLSDDIHTAHLFFNAYLSRPASMKPHELKARLAHIKYLHDQLAEWKERYYAKAVAHFKSKFDLPERGETISSVLDRWTEDAEWDVKHGIVISAGRAWHDKEWDELPASQTILEHPIGGKYPSKLVVETHKNMFLMKLKSPHGFVETRWIPMTHGFFKRCRKTAEEFEKIRGIAQQYISKYE